MESNKGLPSTGFSTIESDAARGSETGPTIKFAISRREPFAHQLQFLPAFRVRFGVSHFQCLERIKDNLGYNQPSVLFVVGGNDMACTRFRRHRVRCFDGAGGGSWRDGSLLASSSLRRCA